MGALLSLPFLAMPAMGTVRLLSHHATGTANNSPGMERSRLLLRCCHLQCSYGLMRWKVW